MALSLSRPGVFEEQRRPICKKGCEADKAAAAMFNARMTREKCERNLPDEEGGREPDKEKRKTANSLYCIGSDDLVVVGGGHGGDLVGGSF